MLVKDADRMANNVDLDQTAPSDLGLQFLPEPSVQKLHCVMFYWKTKTKTAIAEWHIINEADMYIINFNVINFFISVWLIVLFC